MTEWKKSRAGGHLGSFPGQGDFKDRAIKIMKGGYSFYTVTDPTSLSKLVKAFKPPRIIQVKNYYHSPIGTFTIGEGEILVILDAKKGKVVSGSDESRDTFKLPVGNRDIQFSPIYNSKVESFSSSQLVECTVLPVVVAPAKTFTDAKGKCVEGGTHLFLSKSNSKSKSNRNTLKAKSRVGKVSITANTNARFTVNTRKTALTLTEIDEYLSLPISVKPVADDDDISTIPMVNLDSIHVEEIVTALVRFADTSVLPILQLPATLDITACVIAPKTKEDLTEIIEQAEADYVNLADLKRMSPPPPVPERCPIPQSSPVLSPSNSCSHMKEESLSLPTETTQSQSSGNTHPHLRDNDMKTSRPTSQGAQPHPQYPRYVMPPSRSQAELSLPTPFAAVDDENEYSEIPAFLQGTTPYMYLTPHTAQLSPPPCSNSATASPPQLGKHTSLAQLSALCPEVPPSSPPANPLHSVAPLPRPPFPTSHSTVPTPHSPPPLPLRRAPVPRPPAHQSVHTSLQPALNSASSLPEANISYLRSLSTDQILCLLSAMSLECYCEAFRKECIDGELFASLDVEILQELGVKSKIHQLRLKKMQDGHHSAKSILEAGAN